MAPDAEWVLLHSIDVYPNGEKVKHAVTGIMYRGITDRFFGWPFTVKPTHWMPLPEPPTESK